MSRLTKAKCQRRITRLWFVFTIIYLSISVALAIGERIDIEHFINWFFPLFFPNFLLIIGLFINDYNQKAFEKQHVKKFWFQLSFGTSSLYLFILTIFIFTVLTRFDLDASQKVDKLNSYNIILGPLQGVVTSILGVFFATEDKN